MNWPLGFAHSGVTAPRRSPSVAFPPLTIQRLRPLLLVASLVATQAGCSLAPEGTDAERAKLTDAGKLLDRPIEQRPLPELPGSPTWRDVLRRSFLANGDLEASYFQWKAAMERVDAASAYPNANVSLGFEYMFSGERMKSFDRSTFSAGFDPAMSLTLPVKTRQAAKVALDEARVAGEKFRVAKFELQRKVLRAWADYVLQARTIALREEDLTLRRVIVESAARSTAAGMRLREAQSADLELRMSENELLELKSEHEAARAALNALMGRDAKAPLDASGPETPTRALPGDDALMLKAAADVFPEVAAMAYEVVGRADALELARLRWIPDFSPTASFTGSVSQALGAMITLPTTAASIRAGIREAEANLRSAQATLRQRSSDRVAEYVSLLVVYRNAQRQRAFLEQSLLPATLRLSDSDARAYESGAGTFAEVVESRRSLLKVKELSAAAHAEMDKAIVEIECCLGVDIESIAEQAPAPPSVASLEEARQESQIAPARNGGEHVH